MISLSCFFFHVATAAVTAVIIHDNAFFFCGRKIFVDSIKSFYVYSAFLNNTEPKTGLTSSAFFLKYFSETLPSIVAKWPHMRGQHFISKHGRYNLALG